MSTPDPRAPERDELWSILDWTLWGNGMDDVFREPIADKMVAALTDEEHAQALEIIAAWQERRGPHAMHAAREEIARLRNELAAGLQRVADELRGRGHDRDVESVTGSGCDGECDNPDCHTVSAVATWERAALLVERKIRALSGVQQTPDPAREMRPDTGRWAVSVSIPRSLPPAMRDSLFGVVAAAVHAWEPPDRDGWDVDVSGHPAPWPCPDARVHTAPYTPSPIPPPGHTGGRLPWGI